MGKRGPIPKTQALKALSGQIPLKRDVFHSLVSDIKTPSYPKHFNKDEKKVWKTTLDLLKGARILEEKDEAILAAYCYSVVKWRKAEQEIRRLEKISSLDMFLSEGATGTKIANPLLTISRRFAADMVTYAAQLGMTPSARLRVQIADAPKKSNPFRNLKALNHDKGLDQDSKRVCAVFDPEAEQE
jgi:P27 family predicted phage terminase small subunit